MSERELLMIPGPTNVEPAVLRALCKPNLSHTSPEFAKIFKETLNNLKKIFMTDGEVFVVAGSGTLALEMALSNILEPGDKTLHVVTGYFGEYPLRIAKVHGATTKVLNVPWGKAVEPNDVKKALREEDFKAVTVTHVETSTAVQNPIEEIGETIKENSEAFYIVDTVCSLGGAEVNVDDWGIDICASGSQKCIGVPPGLALVSANDSVLEFSKNRKSTGSFWYGDFMNWLPVMRDPTLYFATPPVNMIYALSEALKIIISEGLDARFRRHRIIADAFRTAMKALNLRIVSDRESAADTVTAVYYPEKIDDVKFRAEIKRRGIIVASCLGPLKGKGFRVGHIGNVSENDILSTIGAVETTLEKLGHHLKGSGVSAAEKKLVPL